MAKNVCDVMLEVLADAGVKFIFGVPGGVINTLVDAIRRQDRIQFIHVRHEEAGAFAASAQAKLSGKLAVCIGTSGPGAIHLLNGLYDAKMDMAPVLAITGQVRSAYIGTESHQEIDLHSLFESVSVYNQTLISPQQMPKVIEEAVRAANFYKGVAHIALPMDIASEHVPDPERRNKTISFFNYSIPPKYDLDKAAEILNSAERVTILAGSGARDASEELQQVAAKLNAPIVKALAGKDVLPDENPYCIGGLGLLGTKPGYRAVHDCDCLFMIGTDFPYYEFYPENTKIVQLDIDGFQVGKRTPVDAGLVGDAKSTLQELNKMLLSKTGTGFLQKYQEEMKHWWHEMDKVEKSQHTPIHPQAVAAAISKLASEDTIYCCDTGNVTVWGARNVRIRDKQRFILSGKLASMAFGMSAAIGAKLLYPKRQVIALCGDGGFSMLMGDFLTAVQYKLDILIIIFNNHKLGMIQAEQEVMGFPEYEIHLENPNFAEFAKVCGGDGTKVTNVSQLDEAIYKGLQSGKPYIVDVEINPAELPFPPKITIEQAFGYAKAKIKEFMGEGE
jgi:pyruvate oxidase